jgi:response regulator containing a cheY-like receiver domain and an HTH DNA-binding domain
MIRVLIADDHKMVREGLRRILEFDGEIQVIDEADNGEECIKKIRSSKPDIVLLDINMPVMNGIEALQEIRKKKLKTKVIILTVHNEIEYLLRAVDIGIDGYVLKDSDAHELIRAVTSVYEGDKFIQPSLIPLLNSKLIARDLDAERLEQLSKREIEVLKLVAVGMFNKEI